MPDFIVGIVLFAAALIVQVVAPGGWSVDTRGNFVFIQKRQFLKVAAALWVIPALWLVGFAFFNHDSLDPVVDGLFGLTGVVLIVAAIYGCGPQDVTIDMNARQCHVTSGWIFAPRSVSYPLTEGAAIVMKRNQGRRTSTYSVNLRMQSSGSNIFPLSLFLDREPAYTLADEISQSLHLPVESLH